MNITIYNDKMLEVAVQDMCRTFNEYGELALTYGKPYKDKSLDQLGYVFGGLISAIIEFYKQRGEVWEVDAVKENLYSGASYLDERLRKTITRFNGESYTVPKRLSEMDRETASLFIDRVLYLIDNAKCFKGLYLHPSLRYTWVRHITPDDLQQLRFVELPAKDKEYIAFEHKEPCLWCGRSDNIQVHHLKELGYSGEALKAPDGLTIPLCASCHTRYHTAGKAEFEKAMAWITKYISMVDFCKIRYQKWKLKK